ncbi:MAG: DUF362 domain-containing protein [bacterium]
MASNVYFASMRTRFGRNLYDKLSALYKRCDLGKIIDGGDLVALKLHWGERGNLGFIPPPLVRIIVERVKTSGGKPFLTDTNTLYVGSRRNAVDNLLTAITNGFSPVVAGAPIIIADGLCGHDYVKVKIDGKHFSEVKIASTVYHANALISLAHFKGHPGSGFGGTFKNVGMGCGAASGKQNMHSDVKPSVSKEQCTACGLCIKWCPAVAITAMKDGKAVIDQTKCIGCGECVVVCQFEAIAVNWESDTPTFLEKMVEYTLGVIQQKNRKVGFFNFVINVSPDCDCCSWTDASIVPDIGILASTDPVAVDKAALDLVNKSQPLPDSVLKDKGKEKAENKFEAIHRVGGEHLLVYAEKLGLGSRDYELIEVK